MMKLKIILSLMIGSFVLYLYSSNQKETTDINTPKLIVQKVKTKSLKHRKTKNDTIQKINDSINDEELLKKLTPPSIDELVDDWTDEYGCYNPIEEMLDGENKLIRDCEYKFLNAHSTKEAEWMRNNGYPSKSMLNLVSDSSYKDRIYELARKKYPAALTVVAVEAMKRGDYREASHLALSNVAYSNESQSYPHLLYGEALLKDKKEIAGVTEFYIAALLGDSLANGRAMGSSPDISFSTVALNGAHNYLRNVFGTNIPYDPRPEVEGDDGI